MSCSFRQVSILALCIEQVDHTVLLPPKDPRYLLIVLQNPAMT